MNINCVRVRDTLKMHWCRAINRRRRHELAGYFDERRFVSDAQDAWRGYCARLQLG